MLAEKPLTEPKDDALGRRKFANRLFRAVQAAPLDWPLRIGIYGRWGSGKTTVLNFFESFAKMQDWPVIPFNPWTLKTREEMWDALEAEIFEKIIPPDSSWYQRAAGAGASLIGQGSQVIEGLAETQGGKGIGSLASRAADAARHRLKSLAQRTPEDVAKRVKEILQERRAVVLIDDLDRAPSEILPEMLLSIPYVLSLPQTVFVLALDPTVVGLALKEVHPGWGDGLSFLEKIIDWPRWLPEPTAQDQNQLLASVAPAELDPTIRAKVKDHAMDLISTNPRKLKQFLRQLVLIAPELGRMEPEELHWKTLFACLILQSEFKSASDFLLKGSHSLHYLSIGRAVELARSSRSSKKDEEKPDSLLASLLKDVPPQMADRFTKIYEAIRNSDMGVMAPHLRYYLSLPDEVPIVTRREVRQLVEGFSDNSPDEAGLSSFLRTRATEAGVDLKDVVSPAVTSLCEYRDSMTLGA